MYGSEPVEQKISGQRRKVRLWVARCRVVDSPFGAVDPDDDFSDFGPLWIGPFFNIHEDEMHHETTSKNILWNTMKLWKAWGQIPLNWADGGHKSFLGSIDFCDELWISSGLAAWKDFAGQNPGISRDLAAVQIAAPLFGKAEFESKYQGIDNCCFTMTLSKTQDIFSAKSIYSPEGRLRAIGSAFLEESKHQETQLHLEKVEAAKQSVHSTEEKATVTDVVEPFDPILPSGWRMQDLAESVSWPSKALARNVWNNVEPYVLYIKFVTPRKRSVDSTCATKCPNMPKQSKTYQNLCMPDFFLSIYIFLFHMVFFLVQSVGGHFLMFFFGKKCHLSRSSILAMTPPILELWQQIYDKPWRRISESHAAAKMDSLLLSLIVLICR